MRPLRVSPAGFIHKNLKIDSLWSVVCGSTGIWSEKYLVSCWKLFDFCGSDHHQMSDLTWPNRCAKLYEDVLSCPEELATNEPISDLDADYRVERYPTDAVMCPLECSDVSSWMQWYIKLDVKIYRQVYGKKWILSSYQHHEAKHDYIINLWNIHHTLAWTFQYVEKLHMTSQYPSISELSAIGTSL